MGSVPLIENDTPKTHGDGGHMETKIIATEVGIEIIGNLKLMSKRHIKTANYFSLALSSSDVYRLKKMMETIKNVGGFKCESLKHQDLIRVGYSSKRNGSDIEWGNTRDTITALKAVTLYPVTGMLQIKVTLEDRSEFLLSEEIPFADIAARVNADIWEDDHINITWCLSDIKGQIERYRNVEANEENCREVAHAIESNHDSGIGINWDVIQYFIEDCFPEAEMKYEDEEHDDEDGEI